MAEFFGNPPRGLRQILADWQSAGLSHLPRVEWSSAASVTAAESSAELSETSPPPVAATDTASRTAAGQVASPPDDSLDAESFLSPIPEEIVPASSLSRAEREQHLAELADTVSRCTRCEELARTRTQTVFGVGNPEAAVMFVGEAPGADEDAQGEPFVGKAGQLLNKIIGACGWQRDDVYICNILRCRPPGNRNPSTQEAANCREYLDGQIRIVDPDYIVCLGSVAAQNLLDQTVPIGKLRQKWLKYGRAKVLCTYHPSYLLRNPAAKKPVWEDMKLLLAEMGLEPPG